MKRLILFGLLAALSCAPAAAQVFKCRNAAGKLVYSDSRCPPGTAGGDTGITPGSAASARPRYNPPMPQQEQTAQRPPEPPASQPSSEQGPPARQPSALELEFQAELDKVAAKHAQRDSPACKSAIGKANTFNEKTTTPEDTDRDRDAARQICGYDPWPVSATASEHPPEAAPPAPKTAAASDGTPVARCNAGRC